MIHLLKNIFKKEIETDISDSILINILTRTSGRPKGFKKCRESIEGQTFQNIRHIVSYDNSEDLTYLSEYDLEKVSVKKKTFSARYAKKGRKEDFKPYNLYCNELLKTVKEGWIVFLDDDDMLLNKTVLEELVEKIKEVNQDTLLIWQTRYPDGRLLPDAKIFQQKKIQFQQIDTACFAIHSRYRKAVKWSAWRGADFKYVEKISTVIPNQKWIQKPFTQKNNFGDQGRRNDVLD